MKLLTLSLMLLSFSANSTTMLDKAKQQWVINQKGDAIVTTGIDDQGRFSVAYINHTDNGSFIAFITNDKCEIESGKTFERAMMVNETPVRFVFECSKAEREVFRAKSEKGAIFLYKEFSSKNSVSVGHYIFSAKNFNKAFKRSLELISLEPL